MTLQLSMTHLQFFDTDCIHLIILHKLFISLLLFQQEYIVGIPFITSESSPKVMSMKKNNTAQSSDTSILVTASGYTMKAKPTPAQKLHFHVSNHSKNDTFVHVSSHKKHQPNTRTIKHTSICQITVKKLIRSSIESYKFTYRTTKPTCKNRFTSICQVHLKNYTFVHWKMSVHAKNH